MNNLIYIFIALILFLFDFFSKFFIIRKLNSDTQISVIKNIINFNYIINTGSAFGILKGQKFFLMAVSLFVLIILIWYFTKISDRYNKIFIAFIFAGALGNLVDRIIYGYVIDFISFAFINFPVFNFADIFICTGIFGLLILNKGN
jgi:signal peptidase II